MASDPEVRAAVERLRDDVRWGPPVPVRSYLIATVLDALDAAEERIEQARAEGAAEERRRVVAILGLRYDALDQAEKDYINAVERGEHDA